MAVNRTMSKLETLSSIESCEEKYWRKKRHPYVGGIEITPYCNLNCVHCYLQDSIKEKLMTTSEIKIIIDKLYDVGVLFLYFTGGEIFTRKDFLEIYVYAKQKGFIIELLTNGTLITPEIVKVFDKYPPASVNISVYGKDEATYEKVTGHLGMFERVINSIRLLRKHGIHIEVKYIGMKENQEDYDGVKNIAERHGAVFSDSMELFPTLSGNNCTKDHMMPLEKVIEIEAKQDEKKQMYYRLSNLPNTYIGKKDIPLYLCDMAISNFLIDYQGFLNPCHKCRIKKWNLISNDFQEAWDDFGKLRSIKVSEECKCLNCEYLMMCSPCVMVNYLTTGSYVMPPDTVCKLTHMRVKAFGHKHF